MSLITQFASWYLTKRMFQIELFMKHPIETQNEVLYNLVNEAKDTDWGKKFNYSAISDASEFAAKVPLSTYEDMYPWIDQTLQGKPNILWPGEISWFSKSSGTTNDKSKFIPVTPESLEGCHYKCGKDMLAIYLYNRPDSKLFSGKGLAIGGSHQVNQNNQSAYFGDLSAVLTENMPFFFEMFRVPSKKVALLSEWEEKLRRMADEVIREDVTSIAGVPTWTLVLINKLFEMKGLSSRNLFEIWPNLEVFFHGAVNFDPYRKQFRDILPSARMRYMETYNASEGFFGIQNEPDKQDLLLMLDYGIYYEFIPMESFYSGNPKTLTLDEVETGVNYAIVISTNGGLWRYIIGDTVKFTSRYPFKILITGRTKHYINAFGEELIMDNAEKAIAIASERTGAVVANFTAGPIYLEGTSKGSHQWVIEFDVAPDHIDHFSELLDNELKTLNSDYEAKRYKDLALVKPLINVVPKGTFYTWMKIKGKLGGQNKVPRLANNREYIESVLEISETLAKNL